MNKNSIIIGCNYHTTWQKHPAMRFILVDVKEDKVLLKTRVTKKQFWTDKSTIQFIMSNYNIRKANKIEQKRNKK